MTTPKRTVFSTSKRFRAPALWAGLLAALPLAAFANTPELLWSERGHSSRINAVVFAPHGGTLASGGGDGLVTLWRVSNGTIIRKFNEETPPDANNRIISLAFSPDGSRIAAGGFGEIRVWATANGSLVEHIEDAHTDWVVSLAYSPEGAVLASGSFDGTAKVWNAQDWRLLHTLTHPAQIRAVSFSPDSLMLAVGTGQGTVDLYQTLSGSLLRTLHAPPGHGDIELLYPELYAECEREGSKFNVKYKTTLYQWIKNGNFSIIYGASPKKADQTYHLTGAFDKIAKRFPEVAKYSEEITKEVYFNLEYNNAPYVTCLGGYRLDVPLDDIFVAPNYKVQGSAGWIIGEAMINVKNNPDYIRTGSQMIVQVHDSLKVEVLKANYSEALAESINSSIEEAGLKYLPTCRASYELIENNEAPF